MKDKERDLIESEAARCLARAQVAMLDPMADHRYEVIVLNTTLALVHVTKLPYTNAAVERLIGMIQEQRKEHAP